MNPIAKRTVAALVMSLGAASLGAQTGAARAPRALSLDEAMRLAEAQSEAVQIARAGVMRAEGQQLQARSQYLPQLNGSLQYQRTLKSQFEALQSAADPVVPPAGTPPVPAIDPARYFTPCSRYLPTDANAPVAQRVAALEEFGRCQSAGSGGGIDFSRVGFGAANQYNLGLSGSVNVYTGGRVQAQNAAAAAGRRAAEVEVTAQRAQVRLTVAQAYLDAVLTERLLAIAESSLVQTEATLRQTTLARQVGNTSEFELLRAQVTRDNQRPLAIQRRTQRDLAHLQLKQLLNVPLDDPIALTTELGEPVGDPLPAAAAGQQRTAAVATPIPAEALDADQRAPVREAAEALRAQEQQLRVVRAQRLPAVSVSSQYGRIAFPPGVPTSLGDFLTNWTVAVGASVPLYSGGRIKGEEMVARAGIVEAQQRLQQARELAALDARRSVAALQEAEAGWAASAGTSEQATRAYRIAEIRYREGLSTQLELSESRLLLQQALATRAQAARDLRLAQLRLELLRDLPLSAGGAGGAPAGQGFTAPPPQAPPQPQQRTQAAGQSGPGQ